MDAVNASTDRTVSAANLPPQSFLLDFFKFDIAAQFNSKLKMKN